MGKLYGPPCPGAHDPTRIRVDGGGTNVKFGTVDGLTVTPMGGGYSYQSELGYIDVDDFGSSRVHTDLGYIDMGS